MKYITDDLDYIFIRAQLPNSKWDSLSLNQISDKQFIEWATKKFNVEIKDDSIAKGTSWTKKDKIDFLNDMVIRNNGNPVVVKFKP